MLQHSGQNVLQRTVYLRASLLLQWMAVRAAIRPAKTKGLAGSLDLIIVLDTSICPSKSLPTSPPSSVPQGNRNWSNVLEYS